ncbi:MAG: hypothetical protein IT285_09825 [Bdellovibrionales bacterium]|nr:hypothetical protein [Bdellovibrionales bacterium]
MIRIALGTALGTLVFFFSSASPARAQEITPAISYLACQTIVEASANLVFDRETAPIHHYLEAAKQRVAQEAMRLSTAVGPANVRPFGCPAGYHSSDDSCYENDPPESRRYPNVRFEPLGEPEVILGGGGSVRVCLEVSWLIFSLGDDSQRICTQVISQAGQRSFAGGSHKLRGAIALAQTVYGEDVAGDGLVSSGIDVLKTREQYLGEKTQEVCGAAPDPEEMVCTQP